MLLIMAASLSVCNEEEQCSVIWFFFSGWKDLSRATIHQRLSAQYGNAVLLQQKVCEWIEKLKNGRTSVMDGKGAGCQSAATNEDNIANIACEIVLLDM
jgi:hypothetical protein